MKVDLIQSYKEHYKTFLREDEDISEVYKYDALDHFQKSWDLSALDLHTMFNKSLNSSISGRLWMGSVNSPKSVMLQFIDTNKEFVRSTFRDLFDENKDVVMRMQRFSFHCDQMLKVLLDKKVKIVTHKHNPRMVTVYLSLRYPDKYCIYEYKTFVKCMELFESRNVPLELEIDKFFTLSRSIFKILSSDDELMALHQQRIESENIPYNSNLMIVHDFMEFINYNFKKF